ncbi:MAG: hypothetical protein HY393_03850 [Candidatus Diapherotrites archaeon]|nr:hypothetical protein [Candidatus Diapherotrites archaeon]
MQGASVLKVPNGKLVKARVDFVERLERVQITGDFFMHPEEGIANIEQALNGLKANSTSGELEKAIQRAVLLNQMELVGVDAESLARAVQMAVENGRKGNGQNP